MYWTNKIKKYCQKKKNLAQRLGEHHSPASPDHYTPAVVRERKGTVQYTGCYSDGQRNPLRAWLSCGCDFAAQS